MIEIDGSLGEGGGQVLRTSLSLSCITGKPFRIINIRSCRAKPGLMRQHLVAVQAAARIAGAGVSGDALGSTELIFSPGKVTSGRYDFAIGTAGSTSLVLQTLIPPLLFAAGRSSLTLNGGTHVPFSPSWHYLAEVFAPALSRLGGSIELTLDSCGFYPKGGGKVNCRVKAALRLAPLHAEQRGKLLRITGCSATGNLPGSIAERQRRAAVEQLGSALGDDISLEIGIRDVSAIGQGTFLFLKGEYEHAIAGFTALGARGKPAEIVGREAAGEFLRHHETGMPIDPHLADQLVPYLALAGETSVFATSRISGHLETNLRITSCFLDIVTEVSGNRDGQGTVRITPAVVRQ